MFLIVKAIIILIGGFILYCYWEAKSLLITQQQVVLKNNNLRLDELNILVVGDLHGRNIQRFHKKILKNMRTHCVDLVVFVGDMVDKRRSIFKDNLQHFLNLCEVLKEYPMYFVAGNHENIEVLELIKKELKIRNVKVLENDIVPFYKKNTTYTIAGIEYPKLSKEKLDSFFYDLKKYEPSTILLSHVPKYFSEAVSSKVDLMICGHTHGGQIRSPFIGALYIPDQGWFPKWDQGWFSEKQTHLFITKGVGTTGIPLRFLCKPEMVILKIR